MSAADIRRDLLRSYLVTALAEGKFSGSTQSITAVVTRALAIVAEDVPTVAGEILVLASKHLAGAAVRSAIGGAVPKEVLDIIATVVGDAAAEFGRNGLAKAAGKVWKKVRAAYDDGVRVKTQGRR